LQTKRKNIMFPAYKTNNNRKCAQGGNLQGKVEQQQRHFH